MHTGTPNSTLLPTVTLSTYVGPILGNNSVIRSSRCIRDEEMLCLWRGQRLMMERGAHGGAVWLAP